MCLSTLDVPVAGGELAHRGACTKLVLYSFPNRLIIELLVFTMKITAIFVATAAAYPNAIIRNQTLWEEMRSGVHLKTPQPHT